MTLVTEVDEKNPNSLKISIDGKLDYNLRKEFREAYATVTKHVKNYIVNLEKTTYVDSSGLGMLLILKEHADGLSGTVELRSPSEEIKELLELSNFDKIFTIT